MIAHISFSHLSDPAVALTCAGLFLLYALWRGVLRSRLQEDATLTWSREESPAAS